MSVKIQLGKSVEAQCANNLLDSEQPRTIPVSTG